MKLFWKIALIVVLVVLFGGVVFAILGKLLGWFSVFIDWISIACEWLAKFLDWIGIRGILGL